MRLSIHHRYHHRLRRVNGHLKGFLKLREYKDCVCSYYVQNKYIFLNFVSKKDNFSRAALKQKIKQKINTIMSLTKCCDAKIYFLTKNSIEF